MKRILIIIAMLVPAIAQAQWSMVYRSVKGSPLSHSEVDGNFRYLDTAHMDKIQGPVSGQFAKYNGTNWVSAALGISDVSNLQSTIDGKVVNSITNGVTTIAPAQDAVFDALANKQNTLGYTAEDQANKATSFVTINNTLYPTVQAVESRLGALIEDDINDGVTTKAPTQNAVYDALVLKLEGVSDNALATSGLNVIMNKTPQTVVAQIRCNLGYNHNIQLTGNLAATVVSAQTGDIIHVVVKGHASTVYDLTLTDGGGRTILFEGGPLGGVAGTVPLSQVANKTDVMVMYVHASFIYVVLHKDIR